MRYSLKLFGSPLLESDAGPVAGRAGHRRRIALMALLAAERGRPVSRGKLVNYLWPEQDNARHLLTESLRVIRRALGDGVILTVGDEVALALPSDLAEFEEACEQRDWERAARVYRGPFLEEFYVSDAPAFDHWADVERERLARACARALQTLADEAAARGNAAAAAEWWRALFRHDPTSSRIVLQAMEALAAAGEPEEAVRLAETHATAVRTQLEAEPNPEVEAFTRRLRASPPRPPEAMRPRLPERAPFAEADGREDAGDADGSEGRSPIERTSHFALRTGPAADAAEALPILSSPSSTIPIAERRRGGIFPRRHRRVRPLPLAGGTASFAVALSLTIQTPSPAGPESSRYVVLSPVEASGVRGALTGDDSGHFLYQALERWSDVDQVDLQRVRDGVERRGEPRTLRDAVAVARELDAGYLVWGDQRAVNGDTHLRIGLYAVDGGALLDEEIFVVPLGTSDVSARFDSAARALVAGRPGAGRWMDGVPATSSLAALRAYSEGQRALAAWDLPAARTALDRALRLDAEFASARFWLAQVKAWDGEPQAAWRDGAGRAARDTARLLPRERLLSAGLWAMAEEDFAAACRAYEAQVARDSLDFTGWFGLGECLRADPVVVADPASPSGWSFRASRARALAAYRRALQLLPDAYFAFRGRGYARLATLLPVRPSRLRIGFSVHPDTVRFGAYPALRGDTVAYVPWQITGGAVFSREQAPSRAAAVARTRRELRELTASWVAAFPASPDAHRAFALALEATGEIADVRQGRPSALAEVDEALRRSLDPEQKLELGVMRVRLLLKAGRLARARAAADSLLAAWSEPGSHDAQLLKPLAALTGRSGLARALSRRSGPENDALWHELHGLKPEIAGGADELLVYASLGQARRAAEAERSLEALVRRWVEPAEIEVVRGVALGHSRRVALTGRRGAGAPLGMRADSVVRLHQRLARGDTAGARRGLEGLLAGRVDRRAGDIQVDYVLPEAELFLALGDTAAAVRHLDGSLESLEVLPADLLDRVVGPGCLVRAMKLRAELAAALGDAATARRWAAAVDTLWGGADPELRASAAALVARAAAVRPRPGAS